MTGDSTDIVLRLWSVLPKHWFRNRAPNINAILESIAAPWSWLYAVIGYSLMQTRIGTATDDWLDLIAMDYFGQRLNRKVGEQDPVYRRRVKTALLLEGATRKAISSGLEVLIGNQPTIFEPANCTDTGSYGIQSTGVSLPGTGLAYGQAGGWGNLSMPFQFLITVIRPPMPGVAMLAGYGSPCFGYGEGQASYLDLDTLPGHVTDLDIQSTLSSLLPVNAIAWLRIQ